VGGEELAIEQGKAAGAQPRDQPGQRDLRCIGDAADHRFAEERPAQRKAVEPADELIAVPHLDRMGVALMVQRDEGGFDLAVDPRFLAVRRRFGAQRDDSFERGVGGHAETIAHQRPAQRMRQAEPVERQDSALARLDPIDPGGIAAVGHWEDAHGIGAQQHQRIERGAGMLGQPRVSRSASLRSMPVQRCENALPAGLAGANAPIGARCAAICSTALAIGTTGQSACVSSASA